MGVTESANTYVQEDLLYAELNDQLATARGKDLPPDFLQALAKADPTLYGELMAISKIDLINPLAELDKGLIDRVNASLDTMEQKRLLVELTKNGLVVGKLEVKGGAKDIEIATFVSTPIKVTKSVGGMWLFEGDSNLAYENFDDVVEDLKDYQKAVSKDWGIPADRDGGPFFVDLISGVTFDEAGLAMDDNVSLGNPLDKVKQNAFALHLNEHYNERKRVLGEEQNLASMFKGYGIKDVVVKERQSGQGIGDKFLNISCEKKTPIMIHKGPDGKWQLEQDYDLAYADEAAVIRATDLYRTAILKDWGKVEPEWENPKAPFYVKNGMAYFAADSILPDPVVPLSGNVGVLVQLLNLYYKRGDVTPASPGAPSPEEVAEEFLPETAPTEEDIEAFVSENVLFALSKDSAGDNLHTELRNTFTTGQPYTFDTGKFSLNITKVEGTVQLHLSGTGERTEEENRLWDAYREAVVSEFGDYKGMKSEVVPKGKHETIITLTELPPFMSHADFEKSEAYNPDHTPDLDADDPAYVSMLKDGYSWASPEDDENYAFYKEDEGEEEESPSGNLLADAVVASPIVAASTPSASAEAIKPIANEAEFVATLKDKGWEKYATLTAAEPTTTGEVVIKGLDRGTPEYKYSRIHHFFGKSGVAVKLEDPTQYEIKVSGKAAEWKPTSQYPEGTLVEAGTKNRLWVESGTKIEWKKKVEAPVVASAEPAAPAAPAEPAPTVVAAPVEAPLDAKIVREEWVTFNKAQSTLKLQEIKANGALFGKKAKLAAVAAEKDKLRVQYLALQPKLEKLKSANPEVTPETAFLEDALATPSNTELAKWLGVETPATSAEV